MIQRIQSIFLVLAITCSVVLFLIPVFTWMSPGQPVAYSSGISAIHTSEGGSFERLSYNIPSILINSFIILLSIAALMGYNNRKRQAKLCHLLLLMQLFLIVYVFYNWDQVGKLAGDEFEWVFNAGTGFLTAPLLLFPVARHFIMKDEALVRSADRLR